MQTLCCCCCCRTNWRSLSPSLSFSGHTDLCTLSDSVWICMWHHQWPLQSSVTTGQSGGRIQRPQSSPDQSRQITHSHSLVFTHTANTRSHSWGEKKSLQSFSFKRQPLFLFKSRQSHWIWIWQYFTSRIYFDSANILIFVNTDKFWLWRKLASFRANHQLANQRVLHSVSITRLKIEVWKKVALETTTVPLFSNLPRHIDVLTLA